MTEKDAAQNGRAQSRADFMKRLFAVAVSVGFASPLTRMDWITNGTAPNKLEWQQIMILATALLATIGSWDGYFYAIDSRPLKGVCRFLIDIILVLLYMILLISSAHLNLFLFILAVIFALYVIWDAFTIYEYKGYYYYNLTTESPERCVVFTTYRRGLFSKKAEGAVRRGHIISVLWFIYFLGLCVMNSCLSFNNIYVMCGMASLGLLGYRKSKATSYDDNGQEKRKTGRTISAVALSIVGFFVATALLGCTFK